jgi:hypothetical protein
MAAYRMKNRVILSDALPGPMLVGAGLLALIGLLVIWNGGRA